MKYFIIKNSTLTRTVRPTFTIDNSGKTKLKHYRFAKSMLKKEYRRISKELGHTCSDYDLASLQVVEIDKESYEDYIKDTELYVSRYLKRQYKQQLIMGITSKLRDLSLNELENILNLI